MNLIEEMKQSVVPETWSKHSNICKVRLDEGTQEYKNALKHMEVQLHAITIQEISRVENVYLYGSFLLKCEEHKRKANFINLMTLLHDTARQNADSIMQYNLDWRRASRVKYGSGVSFSPNADYAMKYSNIRNGPNRAMILCDVIVGNIKKNYTQIQFPSTGYDTTTSNKNNVYVKYSDDEFYPKYIVYYTLDKRLYDFNKKKPKPKISQPTFVGYEEDDDDYFYKF